MEGALDWIVAVFCKLVAVVVVATIGVCALLGGD